VGQQSPQDRGRPQRESEVADPWTDDKNRRRAELVDRQIAGKLTDEERAELELLQQQMRAYREKVAPLPIEDTRRLHAELMEKARRAQAGKA
jgi:DNA-directed RNA polymerase subunit F